MMKNTQLNVYDSRLTDLQKTKIDYLITQLSTKEGQFDRNCMLINDICAAYRGDIYIIKEPAKIE